MTTGYLTRRGLDSTHVIRMARNRDVGHWHGGTVDYHSSRLNRDFVMIHASKQAVNEGEQSSQLLGVIRAVVASISIIVLGWSQASTSGSYVYRRVSLLRKIKIITYQSHQARSITSSRANKI